MAEEITAASPLEVPAAPLESDVAHVAAEVLKNKENAEMAGVSAREMVKQAINTIAVPPPPPANAAAAAPGADDSVLPAYMSTAAPAAKLEVEDLVRIAFKDGIATATAAARKSNPFVLDAFHDALAGKLHDELQKRKLI